MNMAPPPLPGGGVGHLQLGGDGALAGTTGHRPDQCGADHADAVQPALEHEVREQRMAVAAALAHSSPYPDPQHHRGDPGMAPVAAPENQRTSAFPARPPRDLDIPARSGVRLHREPAGPYDCHGASHPWTLPASSSKAEPGRVFCFSEPPSWPSRDATCPHWRTCSPPLPRTPSPRYYDEVINRSPASTCGAAPGPYVPMQSRR